MIGYIATILVTLAYLPQVICTIENKRSDMEFGTMMLLLCGMIAWIYYAYENGLIPLFISSLLSLIQISILIYYKVRYAVKS